MFLGVDLGFLQTDLHPLGTSLGNTSLTRKKKNYDLSSCTPTLNMLRF